MQTSACDNESMSLPLLQRDGVANESPHVVILGAGASLAACPNGDRYGRRLPVMANLVETVGLAPILKRGGISATAAANFENLYSLIATDPARADLCAEIETRVRDY